MDILVNNAGIQVYGNFHDANIDDILNLMNVNMFVMTKLTRLFVDGMIKRGNGKILNLASTGVTMTTLCPGATRTNFAKRAKIEDIKLFRGKLLEPSKVAEIGYKALMKDKSVVITGISNKLIAQSIRFIPRSMVIKIGLNIMSE